MEPGSQWVLRVTLHMPGKPTIQRGESGTLVRRDGSGAIVKFSYGIGRVRIYKLEWLEPYPGTISKGFATLTRLPCGTGKLH